MNNKSAKVFIMKNFVYLPNSSPLSYALQRGRLTQAKGIFFVTLGSFTYGYGSSIIATTLAQPSFTFYFNLDTALNAPQLLGAINGLFQAGGFLGALSCVWTANFLGRRLAILVASIFVIVGGGLQAGSVNIAMYLVMRFITGLGIGMIFSVVLFKSPTCICHF